MEKDDLTPTAKPSLGQRFSQSKFIVWCRTHKLIAIPIAVMIALLPLLGLLALRNRHHANAQWTSPIVYPSPEAYHVGNWTTALDKARIMVANMTFEEMNNVTIGISDPSTGCVGVSGGVPRLGFPGFCLQDAGQGVRDTDGVNAYASGVSVGASWNATMAYERAQFLGAEFKRKGVNVALGPVVGPIGRIATDGRTWEGFGADPYLNGILAANTITGLQESVIATVKHFVANEQETNRNPIASTNTASTSANLDDSTMHELYLWPFQDAVAAGVGCVMCSYNRINGTYACENSKTQNGLLKGELNFQGFIVSDWVAQHSGIPSADGGLDMAMPTRTFWDQNQLAKAAGGELNKTRLIDMATRIVSTWYHFGQDSPDFPAMGIGMAPDITLPHEYVDAKDPASRSSLLQQAIEGHVLVKNVNNALPLQNPRTISIFGYDAAPYAIVNPTPAFSILWTQNWQGLNYSQDNVVQIASNQPVTNAPDVYHGTLIVGGGSGSNVPAYLSSPLEAITSRAYDNGTAIWSDTSSTNPAVVRSSDTCLVFINAFASEVWDRPGLTNADSDALVMNVASKCNNTIVVIHNAGIRIVDAWIEHPNVTAVLFAHLPGQDAGRAVAQILYGDVSPSGRLPYTVAHNESDYGDLLGPCLADNSTSPQCDFSEGVNIDYRSFLARNVTPRYEFGYGLTYSSFEYTDLQVNVNCTSTDQAATGAAPVYANGTTQNGNDPSIIVGGPAALFESVGGITASIANTGSVNASEVAQLYLLIPNGNVTSSNSSIVNTRTLRGFQKVLIAPNETAQIEFPLRRKDVSRWDVVKQTWVVPAGEFEVRVGKSVLDTPLVGSFTL
nr:hypothetical protein B0A51_02790 [Rachicladosporium sp. CCFEE 5018]